VHQRHEHFPLHTLYLSYRFLDLRVFALISHLLNPMVYPLGGMPLLLGKLFILFDDLSDLLKIRANLWLWAGLLCPVAWGFGIRQYLL